MNNLIAIMAGALGILLLAFLIIVVTPYVEIEAKGLATKKLTSAEARGREHYVSLNCHACHSQQVRDDIWSNDSQRGWGRPSIPKDYQNDLPHVLGTMRTGPDLANIGERQPSEIWHLIHLYQPRAVVAESNMAPYPFLFQLIDDQAKLPKDSLLVPIPDEFKPKGKKVITRPEAKELVSYLLSLKQD